MGRRVRRMRGKGGMMKSGTGILPCTHGRPARRQDHCDGREAALVDYIDNTFPESMQKARTVFDDRAVRRLVVRD